MTTKRASRFQDNLSELVRAIEAVNYICTRMITIQRSKKLIATFETEFKTEVQLPFLSFRFLWCVRWGTKLERAALTSFQAKIFNRIEESYRQSSQCAVHIECIKMPRGLLFPVSQTRRFDRSIERPPEVKKISLMSFTNIIFQRKFVIVSFCGFLVQHKVSETPNSRSAGFDLLRALHDWRHCWYQIGQK